MSAPRRYSFSRAMRLRGADAFVALHRTGTRTRCGPLVVSGRPNDMGHLRLGLAVGRRVGNAVNRNLIKRRLREAARLIQHDPASGYDVLVRAMPHRPLSLEEYRRLLRRALQSIHEQWTRRRDNE